MNEVPTFKPDTPEEEKKKAREEFQAGTMTKFATFIEAFESLSADMLTNLVAGDVSLHTFISRARAASVAFEGIVDVVGAQFPSGLDIGSFLENFQELCNPTGALGTDLQTALNAYEDMFEEVGIGEGTAAGSGMHITWPAQSEFDAEVPLWEQVLFQNSFYSTQIIPNFKVRFDVLFDC